MKRFEHLKRKALIFRKRGMALGDICDRLKLGKTTVYYWIKGTKIPRTSKQTTAQKLGTTAMQAKYRRLREQAYAEAKQDAHKLLKDPSFRDFIMLYLTEGSRTQRSTAVVTNSNAALIKLGAMWLRKLTTSKITYRVQHHVDQSTCALRKFWSKELGIKRGVIKFSKKSNSGKLKGRNWRCTNGVMQVVTSDTLLRSKIGAWMGVLTERIERDFEGVA